MNDIGFVNSVNSDSMMIDNICHDQVAFKSAEEVLCDSPSSAMTLPLPAEKEVVDTSYLDRMLRGSILTGVVLKLLHVWMSMTAVTSSQLSFDFDARRHHETDRSLEFIFKTIAQHKMFPEEVMYFALCLINKLHAKTGIAINAFNTKIIFLTALCVSNKVLLDRNYSAVNFDYLGGMKHGTIYRFEVMFLNAIQWECEVSPDEMANVIGSLEAIRNSMMF